MSQTITVALGDRSYPILIEDGALDSAGATLSGFYPRKKAIIITDTNVAEAQWPRLQASLEAEGITSDVIILPAGETTKSWTQLASLCDQLLERGVERSDHLIALGGGVIGDLVGFAASIIKRGCNFIQIPTTLLSQVDSSVGGKTAINSPAGKNLVGAFHQPSFVLIDPTVLDTLPIRETLAGYAEVVKYGLINDRDFFEWCESHGTALISGDREARAYAIAKSVSAKAAIVAEDERETTGARALLNLGHTFGHALEAETGFSSELLHGEGVAAGMALAYSFSAKQGIATRQDSERVIQHLRDIGLPASLADCKITASGKVLVEHMLHDKKMQAGNLPFILTRGIGESYLDKTVALGDVERFLDESF